MAGKRKSKLDLMHLLISWGASVVIIGAMLKILHWAGGETMIAAGLITESILFFVTGFNPPAKDLPWERVYPELDDAYIGDFQSAAPRNVAAPVQSTAALDKMLADAKIGPELISSLGDGLRTFGDKVASISKVADAGAATNEFAASVKAASASYQNLSNAFEKASANLNDMANSSVDSKAYHEQVNSLAKNLSALNAVYELELQDSSAHLKSMNKFYSNLSLTMQNFNESMEDSKQFKEEVGRLAKNLASLNAVYGNMLTAMNQGRS
jgi:gliding motility-associated protein GldL